MKKICVEDVDCLNFWINYFGCCYPNSYDESNDISVSELMEELYTEEVGNWREQFTGYYEGVLEESDGGSTGPHYELRTIAYEEVEKLLSLKNGRQLFLLLLPLTFIKKEDMQSARDKIAEQMKSYFSENLCESVSECIVAGLA